MKQLHLIIQEELDYFKDSKYVDIAYGILKKLNARYQHLSDDELKLIAKTNPIKIIDEESRSDSKYYGGIITDDEEFFDEKYVERRDTLDFYESISDDSINVGGKTYYYYFAGGYD